MEKTYLNLNTESLNSPDRNIRKEFLLQCFQSSEISLDAKIGIFRKALLDSHDSVRSLAIEYLSSLFEISQNFDFLDIITLQVQKEKIWSVKYLILKKISKFGLDMTKNKELVLKLSYEIKPQVRIACGEFWYPYLLRNRMKM